MPRMVEVEDVADAVAADVGAEAMVLFTLPPVVTVIGPFKHGTTLSHTLSPSIHTHTHTHTNPQHLYLHIHTPKYYNTYTIHRKLQNVQKRIHPRSNHYYVRTFFYLTL